MIPQHRKILISELAEFIANDFADKNVTSLCEITQDEGVFHYFDNYEDAFDGMLLYDHSNFHIHINIDKGNTEQSGRGRFTLAHELGHYFIEEHRLGLKYGLLEPHASFHNLHQKNLLELEADFFASCLLMPKDKFRSVSGGKKFSLETIRNLSKAFQVSMLAALIRFSQIGTHEIFAVVSKDNVAQWFLKSSDFPDWATKFKVGQAIPQTTVAGEFYLMNARYDVPKELDTSDWFYPFVNDPRANEPLFEQCYYSNRYGYVISLLWFS